MGAHLYMHVCVSAFLVTLWEEPGTYVLFFFIILPQSWATRCAEWFVCARSPPCGHGRGTGPAGKVRREEGLQHPATHTVAEQRDGGRRPSGSLGPCPSSPGAALPLHF